MQNRPTAPELLEAIRELLTNEIMPTIGDGSLRFKVLIAANLLSITERELAAGDAPKIAELNRLQTLMHGEIPEGEPLAESIRGFNRGLAELIRNGEVDGEEFAERVRAHIRQTLIDQLTVSNPKFLAKFK